MMTTRWSAGSMVLKLIHVPAREVFLNEIEGGFHCAVGGPVDGRVVDAGRAAGRQVDRVAVSGRAREGEAPDEGGGTAVGTIFKFAIIIEPVVAELEAITPMPTTCNLKQGSTQILDRLGDHPRVKQELTQSTIEVITGICTPSPSRRPTCAARCRSCTTWATSWG